MGLPFDNNDVFHFNGSKLIPFDSDSRIFADGFVCAAARAQFKNYIVGGYQDSKAHFFYILHPRTQAMVFLRLHVGRNCYGARVCFQGPDDTASNPVQSFASAEHGSKTLEACVLSFLENPDSLRPKKIVERLKLVRNERSYEQIPSGLFYGWLNR